MTIDYYTLDAFQLNEQKLVNIAHFDIDFISNKLKEYPIKNMHLALIQKKSNGQLGTQLFNFDGQHFYTVKKFLSVSMMKAITFKRTVVKNKIQERATKTVSIPLIDQDKIYGIIEMEVVSNNALGIIREIERLLK